MKILLVSCQPSNVVISVVCCLHNQPRRIGYEETHVTLTEDERKSLGELTSNLSSCMHGRISKAVDCGNKGSNLRIAREGG